VEIVGMELFQQAHYENIAKIAARRLYEESSDAGVAYMNYPMQSIMPPHLETDYMTDTEREAALNAGVTPVMIYNGESTIPRMITSHSRTALGAPDYNCLDTSNVTIADKCGDDIVADFSTAFNIRTGVAFKIMDDPASGQVPSFVVTPNLVVRRLWGWLDEWYSQLLIVNPDSPVDYKATVAASRIGNRINAQLDLPTMGGAFQFDVAFYQRTG
jgi:phage tail sheath gpL-like